MHFARSPWTTPGWGLKLCRVVMLTLARNLLNRRRNIDRPVLRHGFPKAPASAVSPRSSALISGSRLAKAAPCGDAPTRVTRSSRLSSWVLAWAMPLNISLSACELKDNLADLSGKLGNPDPETIEVGGRLLVEGVYRGVGFDGNSADGAHLVALSDDSRLAVVPYSNAEGGCYIENVVRYRSAMSRGDDSPAGDAVIPVVVRGEGDEPNALRFYNFACEPRDVTVEASGLPLTTSFARQQGAVVETGSGELWFVDPWQQEKRRVAHPDRAISGNNRALFERGPSGTWMWTLESGEVVARDSRFDEVYRVGEDVSSVMHHSGGDIYLALLDSQETLYLVNVSKDEEPKPIAEEACSVRFHSGGRGAELLYYSPCSRRDLKSYNVKDEQEVGLLEAVANYRLMGDIESGPVLMYIPLSDEVQARSDIGELYGKWGDNDPLLLGERGNLRLSWVSTSGRRRVVVNWKDDAGTLKYAPADGKLRTLAERVVYVSSMGIIADFDGHNGNLYRLDGDQLELIYEQVSASGILTDRDRDRALFVANYDGSQGQLILVEGTQVNAMSNRVQAGSYQFTALLPMVTALTHFDSKTKTATLRLHHTERDEEVVVATGVAEAIEVGWPREGILYSAPAAETKGVYFARVR